MERRRFAAFRKKPGYRWLVWAGALVCFAIVWHLNSDILSAEGRILKQDYWRYWTAWRINRLGQNPYDSSNLQLINRDFLGLDSPPQFLPVILTPPWTLSILSPFIIFDYPASRLLWLLASIILLFVCTNTIWQIYHGQNQYRWIGWLITFTFLPTITLLKQGQITILILLGVIGFLYFIEIYQNDWLAGASLALITIKPQLLILFWIALFLWIVQQRRWKVLFGLGIALLPISLFVFLDNPAIFQQFIYEYMNQSAAMWMTPTLGTYLRLFFGPEHFWLNFVPLLFGIPWLIYFWNQKRHHWQWTKEILPILWVSFLAAIYSWTYDQVLLLLPILATATWLVDRNRIPSFSPWLAGLVTINVLTLVLHRYFTDEFFIWLVPVLFLWHWLAIQYQSDKFIVFQKRNAYAKNPGNQD